MAELRPETKMAIQALVLGSKSQEKAAEFVSSMNFAFREIKKIDQAMAANYRAVAKRIHKKEPHLSPEELYEKSFRHKPLMIKFIKNERKKSIFYQLLILQISGWLKSCCKMHSSTLAKHSRTKPHKWVEKFLEVGPRHRNLPWANTMSIASNYVRHKEEWHFNTIELDPQTKGIRRRKNIIDTLEEDLPKKNARYLLKFGVSEDILFGSFHDATSEILELAKSDEAETLKANCEAWLKALNAFAQKELFKLI